MKNKGFELTMDGYVKYPNVKGTTSYFYVGDYDETVTIEQIEKDFNDMLKQYVDEISNENAKDRKALFAFVYYSVLCCKEF